MNKNISIGVLAIGLVIFGFLAFKAPTVITEPTSIKFDASALGSTKAPVVNVPAPIVNVAAPQVSVNVPRQDSVQTQRLGSVSSPDINSPYFSVGGSRFWNYNVTIPTTLASTSCSIAAPFATSTVLQASYSMTQLGSTSPVEIGWALAPQATTTTLGKTTFLSGLSNNVGVITASSTVGMFIVPPSTRDANGNPQGSFINFKVGAGNIFTVAPTGSCNVTFREVQ